MATLNKIQLMGNLGKDATIKDVKDIKVINFSIGVTEKYKDQEHTDWFDCDYFVKGDKLLQYLTKGTSVFVEGRMRSHTYEKDGQKRTAWSVLVGNLQLIAKKPSETQDVKSVAEQVAEILNARMDNNGGIPF